MKNIEVDMRMFFFLLFFTLYISQDKVSLCSPGYPGTRSIEQASLKLRDLPASASPVPEIKACAIVPR